MHYERAPLPSSSTNCHRPNTKRKCTRRTSICEVIRAIGSPLCFSFRLWLHFDNGKKWTIKMLKRNKNNANNNSDNANNASNKTKIQANECMLIVDAIFLLFLNKYERCCVIVVKKKTQQHIEHEPAKKNTHIIRKQSHFVGAWVGPIKMR